MAELVELNKDTHRELKVLQGYNVKLAAQQQIMKLRVTEVARAVTSFPVFFTKDQNHGTWVLASLTSFDTAQNLFVEGGQWQSVFQPTSMQTPPFYLMQSPLKNTEYAVGILESSEAFSKEQGEALFDEKGQESIYLGQIKKLLEDDIKGDYQTHHFSQKLDEMGLLKPIDVQIHYQDETAHTLYGLHTINEDVLHSLPEEKVYELTQLGYLVPIHAMLISLFQLNLLVKKNNQIPALRKVKQVKMEVAKDRAAA